jgi:nitrite reductase (NO-forming)
VTTERGPEFPATPTLAHDRASHAPHIVRPHVPEITMIHPSSAAALPTAALRILLGVAWTANAALKWLPAFSAGFLSTLSGASQDQPAFLKPWFSLVTSIASDGRGTFLALGSAGLETYLAVALLTGFARKATYTIGAIYTALIWATAEGFGGPYVPGVSTDIGAAIIYTLLFLTLLVNDAGVGFSRLSVDGLLERRMPSWRRVAELDRPGPRIGRVTGR